MSAGFPRTVADINNRAGQLALQLRDLSLAGAQFSAMLNDVDATSQDTNGANDGLLTLYGDQADVDTIKNFANDLVNLGAIINNGPLASGLTLPHQFLFFAQQLVGTR